MKKLWYSYTKELKLSSKSFYFYVEIIMAVLVIAVVLLLIPDNMNNYQKEYIHLDMEGIVKENYLQAILDEDVDKVIDNEILKLGDKEISTSLYISEDTKFYVIDNKQDMIDLTKEDRPYVGASINYNSQTMKLGYQYYLQGYESDRLRNLYQIIHIENLDEITIEADKIEVKSLGSDYAQLNSKEISLPVILTFNGSLMGMFIIAAYIFLDKSEGVIKAYAITASKVWHYLMSKILVLMTVTLLTSTLILLVIMRFKPNYLMFFILIISSTFAFSSVGLLVSSFYNNMNKAFSAIYIIIIVLMLPAITYYIPSWQPLWVTIIPSHNLIQGFKEVITNGDMTYVIISSIIYMISGIIIFIITERRFKKTLTR
jgi:ABC-type multidrug transport system permease subunit